jgi:[ribosomal protein S5]-alanine N-acetyltransferase
MNKMEYKDIESERLLLRKYRITDDIEIFSFLNENREYLKKVIDTDEYNAQSIDNVRKILRRKEAGWLINNFLTYGLWIKTNNKYVGQIMFFKFDWQKKQVELGQYICKTYQGQGIVTEATKLGIDYLFSWTQITSIIAICRSDNFAIHKVEIKCGFQKMSEKDGFIKFLLKKND